MNDPKIHRYKFSPLTGIRQFNTTPNSRTSTYSTPDLAIVAFYKDKFNELTKRLDKCNSMLNSTQQELNDLVSEYEYVEKSHPEEFL